VNRLFESCMIYSLQNGQNNESYSSKWMSQTIGLTSSVIKEWISLLEKQENVGKTLANQD